MYCYANICRICLQFSKSLIKYNQGVSEKLCFCFPELESSDKIDELPSFICEDCFECLEKTHKFKLRLLYGHETLLEYKKKLSLNYNNYGILNVNLSVENETKVKMEIIKVKCNICDIEFEDCESLDKHLFMHVTERPFKCEICMMSFTQKESLEMHSLMHPNRFKCMFCKEVFQDKEQLSTHQQTHLQKKTKMVIRRKRRKLNHWKIKLHSKSKMRLTKVNKRMETKLLNIKIEPVSENQADADPLVSLNQIQENILNSQDKKFECIACQRTFTKQCYLNSHNDFKHSEISLQCKFCPIIFKSKGSYMYHLKAHKYHTLQSLNNTIT